MQLGYKSVSRSLGVLNRPLSSTEDKRAHAFSGNIEQHIGVSAVIITYNEQKIIADTLSRLWWCDEIIVVDSGSTDKTVEICEQYGCSVFTRTFTGFGDQKNYGVSKASNDWILCIDADEILSESLVDEIRKELVKDHLNFSASCS
jgi:glycosyltransferase involved in cell wall biosynthesis